jgi:hypothetical protein
MEDIVIATGVCTTWRNALSTNVKIQQALYLTPVETREIVTMTDHLSERVKDIDRHEYAVVAEPNTSIERVCDQMYSFPTWLDSHKQSAYQKYQPQSKFGHPNGSWRDMFITQPPINVVDIEVFPSSISYTTPEPHTRSNFFTGTDGTSFFRPDFMTRKRTLKDDQGIKMGKLHDFIQSTAVAALQRPLFVRLGVPRKHFLECSITETSPYRFWYEVRDGKVSRQTQPPHLMEEWV